MNDLELKPTPLPADQKIEEIVDEITRRRERLATSLSKLRYRVEAVTHWRRWIQARPFISLAALASLGFLFGKGLRRIHGKRRNSS